MFCTLCKNVAPLCVSAPARGGGGGSDFLLLISIGYCTFSYLALSSFNCVTVFLQQIPCVVNS